MIPIPATQRRLLEQDSGNAALYFARMTPYDDVRGVKAKQDAIARLGDQINARLKRQPAMPAAIHSRQSEILKTAAFQGGTVWEFRAQLRSPFVSGLASGHPTETGFILDRNTGLPCIPASAVKGVLRLACGLHIADKEPDSVQKQLDKQNQWTGQWEIPDTHPFFRRYFGDTDSGKKDAVRGQLCFLDAFPAALPTGGDLFKVDIMNPHLGKYYASEQGPLETESPIPVKFLAVKEGTEFVFRCLALPLPQRDTDADIFRPFDGEDDSILQALFAIACSKLGFGGKTAVGYGRFTVDETRNTAVFRELAEQEAAQRRQQAAAEAELKRQEEDDRLHPWKPWMRELEQIDTWEALLNLVLKNEGIVDRLQHDGAFQAVQDAFKRVREAAPTAWKKKDRDKICSQWLAKHAPQPQDSVPTDKTERIPEPSKADAEEAKPQSELEKLIRAFNDYGAYKNANVEIAALTLPEALVLEERLKKWDCNDKKAKGEPKHWQVLQKRLRELRK
ncbi:MAG: type III-B CRISPR module RAMP protein Cmr6 [bacterium]|nr:type III-B CRISPR module RAMP protein Cmr6 [bacterium]